MKSPCTYNCEDRDIYCHGRCSLYLQYREYQDKVNEIKRLKAEVIGYSIKAKWKMGVGRRI